MGLFGGGQEIVMKAYRWTLEMGLSLALTGLLFLTTVSASQPTEKDIALWVKEAISEDGRIDSSKIDVTVRRGIVTLSGVAKTLAGKKYAVLEAKKIAGVQGVVDEIIVYPNARPDADIRQIIMRRFLNSADLQANRIKVDVTAGDVTLNGQVDSWSERGEAELLATEVQGVRSLTNRLLVPYRKERTDTAILKDVISTIQRDVYLSGLPIRASVKDGVVTLKGTVVSAYERERAYGDAIVVDNVKAVKNDLKLGGEQRASLRKQAPLPSDEELEKNIHDELTQDLRVAEPYEFSVNVLNGNVTLRGTVLSSYQKQLAGKDVRNVVGVGWVDNLITVEAPWREHSAIQDDVQFEVDVDPLLDSQDIDIHVKHGVVTLSGNVNTFYQKIHAGEVASRVIGVRDVVNVLAVKRPLEFSDAAVRDRIKRRLAANAETAHVTGRIKVDVQRGKAVLSGTVRSWAEYREAARTALLTQGVSGLDNRLTVAGAKRYWERRM
jgi:osmotically-inducible protein OsmY